MSPGSIGKRIRELREKQGRSRAEVAERAALALSHVGSIERGEKNVSLTTLLKVAHALDVRISEIVAPEEVALGRDLEALVADIPSKLRVPVLRLLREYVLFLREAGLEVARLQRGHH